VRGGCCDDSAKKTAKFSKKPIMSMEEQSIPTTNTPTTKDQQDNDDSSSLLDLDLSTPFKPTLMQTNAVDELEAASTKPTSDTIAVSSSSIVDTESQQSTTIVTAAASTTTQLQTLSAPSIAPPAYDDATNDVSRSTVNASTSSLAHAPIEQKSATSFAEVNAAPRDETHAPPTTAASTAHDNAIVGNDSTALRQQLQQVTLV
jgi:hypothetical protein